MKRTISIATICILIACSSEGENKPPTRKERIRQTESALRRATGGSPLVIPIIAESDPGLFVIPVTDARTELRIDRVFVLDARSEKENYSIYELDSVLRYGSRCELFVRTIHGEPTCLSLDDSSIISSIIIDINELNFSKIMKHKIPIIDVPDDEW